MKQLNVHAVGIKPLLMHDNKGVNPLHPLTRELKTYTSKRTKTDDDLLAISDLEWLSGIYYKEGIGPYLPEHMILACIENGAKKQRLGTIIPIAVQIDPFYIPLIYDGSRDLEVLKKDLEFRDVQTVKLKKSESIIRTRPRFENWEIEFTINYDESLIDVDKLKQCVIDAGKFARVGDYRKRYGEFIPKFS
jgi:hypothetical protein